MNSEVQIWAAKVSKWPRQNLLGRKCVINHNKIERGPLPEECGYAENTHSLKPSDSFFLHILSDSTPVSSL